ncbi:MAG: HD domain-containing phosphohydrolase [Phycisphaerales bacterium]
MTSTVDPKSPRTVVLLVDDQPIVEAALRRLLATYEDMELLSERTCDGGMRTALAARPDVILQDLMMPCMDGLEQIKRIRANPELADTPLVVLSAESEASMKERCFELGANDYLVKLPAAQELAARIRSHARMGRAQRDRDRAMRDLAASQSELVRRNSEIDAANRKLAAMNDLLGQESQEQRERIAEVAALGAKLGRAQDLDEVMDQTLLLARSFTDAEAGSIWMAEPGGLRLVYTQNDVLQRALPPGVRLPLADIVIPANANSIAGYVATSGKPLRIDDVYALDPSLPYHFKGDVDRSTGYRTRSMLVAPLRDARDEVVGVLQLMNSRGRGKVQPAQAVFTKADEAAVELFAGMASLALERAKLVRGAIMRTIATAEMRDPSETGAHVQRVAECAVAMYDRWAALHGVDDDVRERRRDELRIAAMLHDVGKVAIPDSILKKPGKLDEAEFERIKTHSVLGGRLFADAATPYDEAAMQVAVHHHERWDGTGYPGRFERTALAAMPADLQSVPAATALRGEDIPLFARLVAVADVYDALTSRRSYKEPWSDERVAEFLREESGRHFDPEIVEIALGLLPYFRSVRQRFDVDDRR